MDKLISFVVLIVCCVVKWDIISGHVTLPNQPNPIEQNLQDLLTRTAKKIYTLERELTHVSHAVDKLLQKVELIEQNTACDCGFEKIGTGCYKVFSGDVKQSWEKAKTTCNALGARLVSIETADELAAMYQRLAVYGYTSWWTGGNDIEEEGTWVWDGLETPMNYTRWYGGQPNNINNQDCLRISIHSSHPMTLVWWDDPCDQLGNFVCET